MHLLSEPRQTLAPATFGVLHGSASLNGSAAQTPIWGVDAAVPITFGAVNAHSLDVRTATATAVEFPSNLKLPSHEHERATVAVVLRGGFIEVSRGEERECTRGTVLVEPAGAVHANRFGRQRTSVVTLSLCGMGEGSPVAELAGDLHVIRDPFVASSGYMMECEIRRPDDISPLAVEGWILDLFAHLLRGAREGQAQRWLSDAQEYLAAHFSESIRLADVAGAVGVEPSRLARAFQRTFNEPISAYVRRLRVTAAAAALTETGDSIASIAAGVGFADQSHLTRSFARILGTTPGSYRAQHRPESGRRRW